MQTITYNDDGEIISEFSGSMPAPIDAIEKIFDFGMPGTHIVFSKPIYIQTSLNKPDGTILNLQTLHE
jgi:hypothetical protein